MSMMNKILHLMADKKASDVYLAPFAPALIKLNGQSIPINSQVLPIDGPLKLLSEVLTPFKIQELESTGELNTAMPIDGLGNFRISAMRQRGTYSAVIRFVPLRIPSLNELQVPTILGDLIMEKRGLILVVGSTGSGKSTTMASMLDHRNQRVSGHILTIEDPIEFLISHKKSVVNQREIGHDTSSMSVGLKNALRQAPDVIMIGEIRDREAMTAALSYAQSGHVCIATLHANNSYHVLNRILSFYPVEVRPSLLADLSASLKAVVSQRLLRTQAGTRVPAVEVMLNTPLISDLIMKSDFSGVLEAMEKSMAEGSQTFEQDLARLMREGKITQKEAMAYADSPTNLLWRLQNEQHQASKPAPVPEDDSPSFNEITLEP
jgi:twitching motility protein PilU